MTHATGTFEVQLEPEETLDKAAGIARMSIVKHFQGDLAATSTGEMIATMEANRSGAYAAIERVTGTLNGKSGSFVLLHNGTMTPEGQQLSVTVVPGSGKGELEGLAGKMEINIVDRKHYYEFDYTLPASG
jgi:hypothetical protein